MSGWSGATPAGLVMSASVDAPAGATVDLVAAHINVNGLQLWSVSMSSDVVATTDASAWQGTDRVIDSGGGKYGALQQGLSGLSQQDSVAYSQELYGIVVPAGLAVQLVNDDNGGTVAALHQVSATLVYSLVPATIQ